LSRYFAIECVDVVAAYKELQKEKVALEESLHVLSLTQTTGSSGMPQSCHSPSTDKSVMTPESDENQVCTLS
jgi:hypothetical protein